MNFLIVDGSNLVMRCALGGELEPAKSVPMAEAMIERAVRDLRATHLVIALDVPTAPTWRKLADPVYKANRRRDTSLWVSCARETFTARGWHVVQSPGFEADDVIATLAARVVGRSHVAILSNDSDLLPLLARGNVAVYQPTKGGSFTRMRAADVCEKYDIPSVTSLPAYKAMVGESTDNVKGVPGVGAVAASKLLDKFETLNAIIAAGRGGYNRDAERVAAHADAARKALMLVTLSEEAPIPPIPPSACAVVRRHAGAVA